MRVKRKNKKPQTIPVTEMENGQIGRIVSWCEGSEHYNGYIVKRAGNGLISLSADQCSIWEDMFTNPIWNDHYRQIELIDPTEIGWPESQINDDSIPVGNLEDEEIAEVVKWANDEHTGQEV